MRRRGVSIALCALGLLPMATTSRAGPPDAAEPARARGVVAGRVTDSTGAPVGDLEVRVVLLGRRSGAESLRVRTAADGRYRCENVPIGDVAAFVADRGLVARGIADFLSADAGPLARTLRAGATASIDLVVERGAQVTGQVLLDGGRPLAGTAVDAVAAEDSTNRLPFAPPAVSATTGTDGSFKLEGLAPGLVYDVRVTPDGAPAFAAPRVTAGITVAPIAVRLPRLGEVRLTVVEEAAPRPPVGGARVRLSRRGRGPDGGFGREVRTDAQGHARILVPDGEPVALHVDAPERGPARLDPLPTGAEIVVPLPLPRTLTGRVLLPDGKPAVGADVADPWDYSPTEASRARTGVDGRFTLKEVEPGELMLAAGLRTPEGTGLFRRIVVEADAKDVVLVLQPVEEPPRAELHVKVIGSDGKAVSRAFVGARTPSGGSVYGARELADGGHLLDLARVGGIPGAHVLVAHPEDDQGTPLPFGPAVVGPLAADAKEIEVRLPPERILTGRVVARDVPVVGAGVRVGLPNHDGDDVRTLTVWANVRTDEEGRFRVHGLPDEDLGVYVSPPLPLEAPPRVRVSRGTNHVDVTVEAAGRTEVTVLDVEGAPVVGAQVCAVAKGDRCPSDAAKTDARGVAIVTGLRPHRRYVLRVDPSWDFLEWTQADWAPAPTTVRIERAYEISGTVRAADGTPIVEAFVEHDDAATERWARSTRTDAAGRFGFQRLKAGPLTLSAALGHRLSGSETVPGPATVRKERVEAGARDLVLVLEPGLTVVILPPAGTPKGADIYVHCTRGAHVFWGRRIVREREPILVEGLLDGDRLTIFMPPDASGRSVAQVARPVSPIQLERRAAGTIRGRVVLPEGAVGASVRAHAERAEATLEARADATGRYEIRGVPEGWSWKLHAAEKVNGVWHEAAIEHVERGEAPDLVLKPAR